MKRFASIAAVALFVSIAIVFAQGKAAQASAEVKQAAAKENAGIMKEGMAQHMSGAECMHGILCRKMAPSSDGGVFILSGNRLLKYDASLTLQKEVEIIEKEKTNSAIKKTKDTEKAVQAKPAPGKKQ